MQEEAKRTLAYLCPVCGKSVIVERTPFQLAATVNHLPCPCGKSELVVEMAGGDLSEEQRTNLYYSLDAIANNLQTISEQGLPQE